MIATPPSITLNCIPGITCSALNLGGGAAGGALLGAGAQAGGALFGAAASAVFGAFSNWLMSGASWLVSHVLNLIVKPGNTPGLLGIRLTGSWFASKEHLMVLMAGLVMMPLLLAATIGAVLHQDLGRLARTWGVALPAAVLCAAGGVALTGLALRVSDALCQLVVSQSGTDVVDAFGRLGIAGAVSGNPEVVGAMVAVLLLLGGVLLWLELLMRAAAIYVAVFFLPLALSAMVWPPTARVAKRMIELLCALILSKFVVVATLALGAGAVGRGNGVNSVVTGGAILLLAAFAPFALLRLIPIVEIAAIGHLEGLSHRPFRAAGRAATAAAAAPGHPVMALAKQAIGRGGADPTPSSGGTAPLPERKADF
ncbi:MAG: hypothetical protein ACYC1D_19750, partial [Acidimicrobiales bacterium]